MDAKNIVNLFEKLGVKVDDEIYELIEKMSNITHAHVNENNGKLNLEELIEKYSEIFPICSDEFKQLKLISKVYDTNQTISTDEDTKIVKPDVENIKRTDEDAKIVKPDVENIKRTYPDDSYKIRPPGYTGHWYLGEDGTGWIGSAEEKPASWSYSNYDDRWD